MAPILFKWLFFIFFLPVGNHPAIHPYYVSVTEIEHNPVTKSLEISCKIFTDDFEQALRKAYSRKIDLLDSSYKHQMAGVVNDYILKHLQLQVNKKNVPLTFIGFEQDEEGVISFFEAKNITSVSSLTVTNNILYEYKEEQVSLLHLKINGLRKSHRMYNPEEKASFTFN